MHTASAYYTVGSKTTAHEIETLKASSSSRGMSGEVMIGKSGRTFFEYLMRPIGRVLNNGMRQ
jgi:hypothetical protein